MISSDEWVIESNYLREDKWVAMSRGSVGQEAVTKTTAFDPMVPTSFERAVELAVQESGWNSAHYAFRFRNVSTDEVIPFDLFPEIRQFVEKSK